jgi:TonB family protein
MMAALEVALGASLVLLAAIVAAALLRHQSAALRHLILAIGLAGALAVGPLAQLAPPLIELAPVHEALAAAVIPIEAPVASGPAASTEGAGWTWAAWLVAAWVAGTAARLLWLLSMYARLARETQDSPDAGDRWADLVRAAARAHGLHRRVAMRVSAREIAPATWGWRHPVVLVPASASCWTEARLRLVLLHELAHVRRLDWPIQIVGEIACAVFWFNPLAWLARANLRRESERACDDRVLACGVSASDYGLELAAIARLHQKAGHAAGAMPMARPSSLERRIVAMLDPAIDRRPLTRRTIQACAALAVAALLPSVTLRVAAQDRPGPFTVQVFDPSGGVLPGASLEIEGGQDAPRSAVTDASGRALFQDIAPGAYTLRASLAGFRTLRAELPVRGDRDRQRAITLQVGELEETVSVRERRRPPAAPPTGAPEPLRIGGNIKAPKKLRHVSPDYPASMRDAGLEGTVPMEALIGRDGAVASVRVLSADVHPEFARAAEDAVRQWLFSPTLLNGEAVDVRMTVHVRFSFQD